MAVRLAGIGREPFWLDEIFTYQESAGPVRAVLAAVARDAHPPLYFLGVWAWRRLVGDGEAAIRAYGVLWSLVGLAAVAGLVRELGGSRRAAAVAGLLWVLSPLDVYFAQEARPYGQAGALAAVVAWLLVRWLRGRARREPGAWRWLAGFAAATAAMLLTHYVTALVAVALGLAAGWTLLVRRDLGGLGALAAASGGVGAALVPWLRVVLSVRGTLYAADRVAWIPVPGLADLGGLFLRWLPWGHVPLPGAWRWVAAGAAGAGMAAAWAAALRSRCGFGRMGALPIWLAVAPAVGAWVVSHAWHPVLFPPRFAELALPFALAALAMGIEAAPRRALAVALAAASAGAFLAADVVEYLTPQKVGLAGFARLWHEAGPPDAVYFYPRWNRRVAGYYLGFPVEVPPRRELERRLRGDRPLRVWVCTNLGYAPDGPSGEAGERTWLLGLGPRREIARVDGMTVVEVRAQPFERRYPPLPRGRWVEAGLREADRYLWSGWWGRERTFRWSRDDRSVVLFALERPEAVTVLEMEAFCYGRQRLALLLDGEEIASFVCAHRQPRTWRFPVGGLLRRENTLIIEHPDAVSPAERGRSRDRRRLAVGLVRFRVR